MIKIGVIGTGNIGKRHIQSALKMDDVEIFAFDHNDESLNSLNLFLEDLGLDVSEKVTLTRSYENFLDLISEETIVIISTTAKRRSELVINTLDKNPKALIIEKPVCQNVKEYVQLLENTTVPIYVNFPRCSYKIYRDIKVLARQNIEEIKIILSQNGIATNGIHMLDLIFWLLEKDKYVLTKSEIFNYYETKRKNFFDFSGYISFTVDNVKCSFVDVSFKCPEIIQIFTRNNIISVYEQSGKVVISEGEKLSISDFTIPFQSNLTSKILEQIVNEREVFLPEIKDCFSSHSLLFEVMNKHNLSKLNIT